MRKLEADVDDFTPAETSKEVEVFPGRFERRHFLRGSLATAAALAALGATPKNIPAQSTAATAGSTGGVGLSWDEFLKLAVPVAQQLIADPAFSVDEYLYRIGSLATRLKEIPDSKLGPYTAVDPRVFFGPSFRGTPFFIIQWRMEPGAVLPPHNHPNASVCTLGFEGEAHLRNFEIVGGAPDYSSGKTFLVRETHDDALTRGRISTLSPSRDNIHYFRVGVEGARGIDINTMHGKPAPFSFLEIGEKPLDSKRTFEAAWSDIGRDKPAPNKP